MAPSPSIRILYMEDDPGAARLLQKRLNRLGHSVDIAGDGEEGLAKWSQDDFELLAVDQDMPRLTGLEVIRELAARGPLPPTIMITGAGNETIAVEAMKLGADDYIIKDSEARYLELVASRVEETLRKRELLAEKRRIEEDLWVKHSALESSLSAVALADLSGTPTYVNQSFLDLWGYESEQGVYKASMADLFDSPETGNRLVQDVLDYGSWVGEAVGKRSDGSLFDVQVTSTLVMSDDGAPLSLFAWFLDITQQKASAEALRNTRDELEIRVKERTAELETANRRLQTEIDERRRAEAALRESEEMYRLLAENATDLISSHAPDGTYLYASQSFRHTLGYEPDELLGHSAYEFFHHDDLSNIRESHDSILDRSSHFTVEYRIRNKDGSYVWLETVSRSVTDPQTDEPIEILAISRDISKRKEAEAQLQKVLSELEERVQERTEELAAANELLKREIAEKTAIEERLRAKTDDLTERIKELNCLYGISNFIERDLQDLDEILHGILRLTLPGIRNSEQACGRLCFEDNEYHVGDFTRTTSRMSSEIYMGGVPAGSIEIGCPDLTEEADTDTFLLEEQNLLDAIAARIGRVIERFRTEEALRRSEERFRRLFESAPVGIFYSTIEGRLLKVNAAMADMAGHDTPDQMVEEVNRTGIADALYTDGVKRDQIVAFTTNSGTWKSIDNLYRRRDGSTFLGSLTMRAIRQEGKESPVLEGFVVDVTEQRRTEEALKQSEKRLESALEGARLGLWDWDIARNTVYRDERWSQITGISVDPLADSDEGRQELIHPDDRPGAIKGLNDHLAGLTPGYLAEYRLVSDTGSEKWMESRGRVIERDPSGAPLRMTGTILDITERKNAEISLRESEQRYRALVETMNEGLAVEDANGMLTYVNEQFAAMVGCSQEELIGKPSVDFVHPDASEQVREQNELRRAGEFSVYETSLLTKTGEALPVVVSATPRFDDEGRVIGDFAVFTDISERRHAEDELRKSEERYRLVVENAQEGIFVIIDGRIAFVNSVGSNRMGYSSQELSSRPFYEFVHPDDRDTVVENHRRRLSGEEHMDRYSLRLINKSGHIYWVELRIVSIIWEGRSAVLVFATDITSQKLTEEALRQSEQNYRLLAENTTDVIWRSDENGVFTYVSPSVEKLRGFTAEENTAQSWEDVLTPDSLQIARNLFSRRHMRVARGEQDTITHRVELEQYCKDGSTVWVEVVTSPVYDEHGQWRGIVGVSRDISDRKAAEDALNKSQQLLESIIEQSPFSLFITDQEGTLLRMNTACKVTMKVTDSELVGKYNILRDNVFREQGFLDRVESVFNEGRTVRFEMDYDSARLEHPPVAETVAITLDLTVFPIKDAEGRVTNAVIQHYDISERKRAELALRESEERFRNLFEMVPDAIFVADTDSGNIVAANPAVEDLLGMKLDHIIGRHHAEIHVPERRHAAISGFNKSVGSGESRTAEHVVVRADGTPVPVEVVGRSYSAGDRKLALGVFRDISERKKSEQLIRQADRMRAVADLAAGVAHNFNNLLQIVLGNANLAVLSLESGDFSEMGEYLHRIIDSAQFGAETVRRLSTFAKGRDSASDSSQEVFDLSNVVRQAIDLAAPWWKTGPHKQGRRIVLQDKLRAGCYVKGHANDLFEVVVNLIKNAAEAIATDGRIEIVTSIEGDGARLQVSDNGIGIAEENMDRIFMPFFTSKTEAGTGLGLASSRTIVTEHGGSIILDSTPGRGTTVSITLPVTDPAESKPSIEQEAKTNQPLSVLLIDDMDAVLEMLKTTLGKRGHTVHAALSGPDGLKLFSEIDVDIVITDLAMPGMNGHQVARSIKDDCERRRVLRPPVIILTGWGNQGEGQDLSTEPDVDAVVAKPVDTVTLEKIMQELVQQRAAQQCPE